MKNYLASAVRRAEINPTQWGLRVPDGAQKEVQVIRRSQDLYPKVVRDVDKETGNIIGSTRTYRNAEIRYSNGCYHITDTCTNPGHVTQIQTSFDNLPELRSYFKEMLPKYADKQYKAL